MMAEPLPYATVLLPRPRTKLLGRRTELLAARKALLEENVPLLSLLGLGGVGKTRLALAIAADVTDSFADGVVWVDLALLIEPALVSETIAHALGIVPTPGADVDMEIIRRLRPWQSLLLFDNCEHLLPAVSAVAARLLANCPALQVLATSRSPLRVCGEQQLLVAPLPVPAETSSSLERLASNESVCLFIERTHAVSSGFALDATNAETVAEICRRLDGLPLAIELAAARVAILSPSALLAQLSSRLHVLTRGSRDAPVRHHTLREAIAWSYDLLSRNEQRLFRQLAVFAGGFTLEAAEAIGVDWGEAALAGDGEERRGGAPHPLLLHSSVPPGSTERPTQRSHTVIDLLASLAEQSLIARVVRPSDDDRFVILETVREFALEALVASGEEAQTRSAHAAYFLSLAEEAEPHLAGQDQVTWLHRLDADHANLRAALSLFTAQGMLEQGLRLAGALGPFWWRHGHFHEGRRWLELLLPAESSTPSIASAAVRAKAFTAAGILAWAHGDFARADACHETAREAFATVGDDRGVAHSLYQLATGAKMRGDLDLAAAQYEASLARYRAVGDVWGMAAVRHAFAVLALDAGDVGRSEALLAAEIAAVRSTGDRWLLGATLGNLGMAIARQGELHRGTPLLEEALELMRSVGERRWIAHIRSFQGLLAGRRGDSVAALTAFREALLLAQELAVRFYSIEVIERIAALLVANGQPRSAVRLFAAAASWRHAIAAPALPADRDDAEHAIAAARTTLGESTFSRAWAAGRALSGAEAVTEALALTTDLLRTGDTSEVDVNQAAPVLTMRERDVLMLLCRRYTDAEIACQLFIGLRTVNHHVSNVLGKLGASNRREAAALAARHALV
jgi:predicted ATPase/DNA-binding CsgD family transcriptional regulator